MPIAVALKDQWSDGKRLHVIGLLTPTGNYAAAGVTINFAQLVIAASRVPKLCLIQGTAGYELVYVNGTNAQDGKILAYSTAGTPLTDAAAWPAGLTGVGVPFYAIFEQFL
jgi:hypothetical protein